MIRFNTHAIKNFIGVYDVSLSVWRALVAEWLGTFFLVLVGCGSTTTGWNQNYAPTVLQIALCFGLTVASMMQVTGHVSGGHINPAVTVCLLVSGQVSLLRAVLYILAQCVGAVAGAGILIAVTPSDIAKLGLGHITICPTMTAEQGLVIEALITAVMVLVMHAVCDLSTRETNECKVVAVSPEPLAIGLAVATCHVLALPYTGSGMNPARSLGPAVFADNWEHHWVYWAGPIIGAVCSAMVYKHVFRTWKPVEAVRSLNIPVVQG